MARNKTICPIILPIAMLVWSLMSGCTHNNGDIGPWFGAWMLNAIEVDGQPSDEYPRDTQVWKFQSTVINVSQIYPHHYMYDSFGSWEQLSATKLELNFGHYDNATLPGEERYEPPVYTHLPKGAAILDIVTLTDKKMVLTYLANDGVTYTYRLSK